MNATKDKNSRRSSPPPANRVSLKAACRDPICALAVCGHSEGSIAPVWHFTEAPPPEFQTLDGRTCTMAREPPSRDLYRTGELPETTFFRSSLAHFTELSSLAYGGPGEWDNNGVDEAKHVKEVNINI